MAEINDPYDVGGSANDRRWKYLNNLAKLLSEGRVELEDLVNEVGNSNAANQLDHGFLKRGKRSPGTRKNSGLKITFKKSSGKFSTVVCSQSSFSQNITTKKPTDDEVQTLHRNPIFTCKRKKGFENGEGSTSSRKKSKERITIMNFRQVEEPTLPETFKNRIVEIGGCLENLVLVIEKRLSNTDVCTGQCRLSVPYRQVKNKFLESYEVDLLESMKGIRAALLQPSLEECQITFNYWKSNSIYVLLSGWNGVCRNNSLTEGIIIQLWSFRRNSELCFAILQRN